MDLHDLGDFFRLSAILNLQLSAKDVGIRNVLSMILGRKRLTEPEKDILIHVLEYLDQAYGSARRRLGPLAVLHPLRATALLARASEQPLMLDLLTCLLHDKLEDLPVRGTSSQQSQELETRFTGLLGAIDPKDEWWLMERLDWLTRRPGQSYFAYIGRLLDNAEGTPALVRVKLADRLDNTLDMRMDVEDPIRGIDFFQTMFRVMFVESHKGYVPDSEHRSSAALNGAQRLYQLFKNAVLLSMVRRRHACADDATSTSLFNTLAIASMKEAERIVLHIFGYHDIDVEMQRHILADVMAYAQRGGLSRTTKPGAAHVLDGLFLTLFEDSDHEARAANMAVLYADKILMAKTAMAFIVIFLNFLEDREFFIQGIEEEGIQRQE